MLTLAMIDTFGSSQNVGVKAKCLLCRESRVRITVSDVNFHDMTNSVPEVPKAGVQRPGWRVTLDVYV